MTTEHDAFVGRLPELAELRRALEAACEGAGRVVLLGGEPGIGKTRLAQQAAAMALARGMATAWGWSAADSGSPAYWPWTQVLRAIDEAQPTREQRPAKPSTISVLNEAAPIAGTALLAPTLEDTGPHHDSDQSEVRFRLFHRVVSRLREVAERRPLLVVIDDLDIADDSSIGLFTFVAQALASVPLILVATFREERAAAHGAMRDALADLHRLPFTVRLRVPPLSADDVHVLLEAGSGGPVSGQIAGLVCDRTAGVPFFVSELARALAGQPMEAALTLIPPAVRDIIHTRSERLSAPAIGLLNAAAVLGYEFTVSVAADMLGQSPAGVLGMVAEAEAEHLLVAGGRPGRYRFAHAIIRDARYETIAAGERVALHLRAAEVLERRQELGGTATLPALAHHFTRALAAGTAGQALKYAELAARHAEATPAPAEAAQLYDMALTALDECDWDEPVRRLLLLMAAGRCHEQAGHHQPGRERLLAAAALAQQLEDPESLVRIALSFERRIQYDRALRDLFDEALRVTPVEASAERLHLLIRRAGIHPVDDISLGLLREGARYLSTSDNGRRLAPVARAAALMAAYQAGWRPEALEERLTAGRELVDAARESGDSDLEFYAVWMRVLDLMEAGRRTDIDHAVFALQDSARRSRRGLRAWVAGVLGATMATIDGRFAEAAALARDAGILGRLHHSLNGEIWETAQLCVIEQHQRVSRASVDALRTLLTIPMKGLHLHAMLVLALIDLDERQEATILLNRYVAALRDEPPEIRRLGAVHMLGVAAAQIGDERQQQELYAQLLPYSGHCAITGLGNGLLGAVDRPLALLAVSLGRWEEAAQYFERAVAINDRLGARTWAAVVRCEYAAMLLDCPPSGRYAAAEELLSHARATAEELGMSCLLERTTGLLDQLSASAVANADLQITGKLAGAAPAGLTRRELEVLRMIAAGNTNREIAERLVLSPLTVTRHISNIYAKIDARGRADATSFAIQHGITEH